ncbi:MAG: transglycosylase domain-containing protein [Acidimicrobiales bacterium]
MPEPTDRLAGVMVGALRLVAALALCLLVVPPVAAAVAGATLLHGPVPAGELPDERPPMTAYPSVVLDRHGNQIAVFRGFDRTVEVAPGETPEVMKEAVIAIEDQRFWEHPGVDVEGIARAARTNLEEGGVAQGGSTITQQYIKNVYLSGERTIERKVEEALLALELEKRQSKEEILFGYLTTSYFGEGAYGIGAAAEVYFAKPVSALDISEAATLAGLVQAPTRLSPRQDLEASERRRRLVLQSMYEQGYLPAVDLERETARQLWVADGGLPRPGGSVTVVAPRPAKGAVDHPFFVDWVEADLLDRLGPDLLYRGGLTIETTIDPRLQAEAEAAVADRLRTTEYPVEMSLVSLDPTSGLVVAMVGGRDYGASQVNLATGGTTGFQPGSSFKPIVMAAALEMGIGPDTTYPAPGQWTVRNCSGPQCTVSNYDYASRGDITLREAMRASVNTVFAQLVLDVSIEDTVALGRRLGLERLDPEASYGASLALGAAETSPLEMASAYGTFANRGVRVAPTGIRRVVDRDGNVLVDNSNRQGEVVVDQAVADNMTHVLTGVIDAGTGTRARLDRPAAGKTGTAQNYRAAWFVGYTPDLTTAVWMGHADRLAPLRGVNGVGSVTGGSHPAIAWQRFMQFAHEGREVREFPEPSEIVPRAETAAEVELIRPRDETEAGRQRTPATLAADCGGTECFRRSVPVVPRLPPPAPPPTLPIAPQGPTGDDGTASTPTSTTTSTATARPTSNLSINPPPEPR